MEFGEGFIEEDSPAVPSVSSAQPAGVAAAPEAKQDPTPTSKPTASAAASSATIRRPVLLENDDEEQPSSRSYRPISGLNGSGSQNGHRASVGTSRGQDRTQSNTISLLNDEDPGADVAIAVQASHPARPLFGNPSLPSPSIHIDPRSNSSASSHTNGYRSVYPGSMGGPPTSSTGTPLFSPHTGLPYSPGAFSQMNASYAAVVPGASLASYGNNYYYGQPYHTAPSRAPHASTAAGSSRPQHASAQSSHAQLSRTSSGAVIDLTENDEDGAQSSDDEVTITAEKMPLKPPKDEGSDADDDLQVVGEKTSERNAPLCIGQLTGVALILYPIPELRQTPEAPNTPLQVALLRTSPTVKANGVKDETIKLYSSVAGTNFGVVEQRLANVLGPMMTRDNKRGLGIWIEAWVVRTSEKSVSVHVADRVFLC